MTPLSPGIMNEPGLESHHPVVTFKWNKVDGAVFYNVFISKKVGNNYKLFHDSADSLSLTDTIYTLSKKKFEKEANYRWNFKATYPNGKEEYSPRLYFYTRSSDDISPVEINYPGELKKPGKVIGNLTPRFHWQKARNAAWYNILVEELTDSGASLVFNSEEFLRIEDTTFMIPDGIMYYDKIYRWRIVAHNEVSTLESGYLYFNTQLFKIPLPPNKIQVYPIPGETNEGGISFRWNQVANARGYGLLIKRLGKSSEREVFNSENDGLIRDTTYSIAKSFFDNTEKYSVVVRAYGRAGWGKYSKSVKFEPDFSAKDKQPVSISPGSLNKGGQNLNEFPSEFKWKAVANAEGYGFYISRKTARGKYQLLFSSETSGLIIDTVFTIPQNLLSRGESYRWNIRARVNNNWTKFSSRRYFNFGVSDEGDPLVLLNPGVAEPGGNKINTLNPTFRWRGAVDVDSYNVVVEKLENGKFSRIFETGKKKILTTTYLLKESVLENNSDYRWRVIADVKHENKISSHYFYFTTDASELDHGNLIAFSSDAPEEVFLTLQYANVVDKDIIAFYYNHDVYLPILEIFNYFEIQATFNPESHRITGFFPKEKDEYVIDLNSNSYNYMQSEGSLDSAQIIKTDFDYFLKSSIYDKIFGIEFLLLLNQLVVKTYSKIDLPVYARYIRNKSYENIRHKSTVDLPLIFDSERALLNFGVVDYSLNYNVSEFSSPLGNYNFGVGGELLYGETSFNTRGVYINNKLLNSQTDLSWRYIFDENKYISRVTLGSQGFDGLEFFNFNGIKVTNNPVEPRQKHASVLVHDKSEPSWTIELYINNRLLDVVKADASGNYTFNLPLNYGTTLIELREYGLNGEYRSRNKLYQTPFTLFQPGEFIYNFSLGKQRFSNNDIVNINSGYGIANWLTTKIGVEYQENSNSSKPVFYTSSSARLFGNNLLNVMYAPSSFYRLSSNTVYFNQSSISLDYTRYFKTAFFNPAGFNHEFSAGLFYPMHLKNFQINFRAAYDYSESQNSIWNNYDFGISSSLFMLNPFINYTYSNVKTGSSFSNQFLEAGFSYSLQSLPFFLNKLSGNLLSVRTTFDLNNSEFLILSANLSSTISSFARAQLSYLHNFNVSDGSIQLQVRLYFPDFQYSAGLSNDFISQNLVGSVGYNKITDDIDFYQQYQVGKATAIFRPYVDENANNIFDASDRLLPGAKIYLGTSIIEYDKSGIIRARELNVHTRYEVSISEEDIKNPLLIPKYKAFAFKTDANPFKVIDIPFYESGELDGYVYSQINGYKNPVSGLRVKFLNTGDNTSFSTATFNDGSFYYYGIKPGKYKIELDVNQLAAAKLVTKESEYFIEVYPGSLSRNQEEVIIYLIKNQ